MAEPKGSGCAALRPLALKIAKVYKLCAVVVKKTDLMEGLADTYGIRTRRKGSIVDWLVRSRVLYRLELEYFDRGLLTYAGVVTLLEKHEWPDVGWNCQSMGGWLVAEAKRWRH